MNDKIKVLAVDDSFFFRATLTNCLKGQNEFELVKCVSDGTEAIKAIAEIKPQIVITDLNVPDMSGIDLIKAVIKTYPCAFILISSANISVFDALSAGAVDFLKKPYSAQKDAFEDFKSKLLHTLHTAASAKVIVKPKTSVLHKKNAEVQKLCIEKAKYKCNIVAIGASTGGTEAIANIMKRLPSNCPGVIIVQHMPKDFTKLFAERLNKLSAMEVNEAENMDRLEPGKALVAPGGYQLIVKHDTKGYYVCLGGEEKIGGHCPSVSNMFSSVAGCAKDDSIGVILTGMGRDGSTGLLEMKNNGAYTIGQDENSCVVYGMPMEAYKLGAVTIQLPCDDIADEIVRYINS